MKFSAPRPFLEALNASQVKALLPTSLGSADLAQLHPGILDRARFSAKVRSAAHLQVLDDGTNDIAAGQLDFATARLRLKQFLGASGCQAPEELRGTLQDFASDARTNLQLRMNVQMAQGYGWHIQGQDPDLLDAFPAREFLRVEDRDQPRTNWPERWNAARAATVTDGATDAASGRMVALVGHPIWKELNVFGHEYEPFDYGSGMGTEDVSRADAIALDLIGRDTRIFPQRDAFNDELQASPEIRSDHLRSLLEESGVGRFNARGVFVHAKGGRP